MIARIYASRNAFFVAGVAAVLTFLALLWVGKTGDRVRIRDQKRLARTVPEKSVVPSAQTAAVRGNLAAMPVVDHWTPAPIEIVKLTAPVTIRNSRGKEVKQFPVGKRLRVTKRSGDQVTIDYLGDEYPIPAASTEPSE